MELCKFKNLDGRRLSNARVVSSPRVEFCKGLGRQSTSVSRTASDSQASMFSTNTAGFHPVIGAASPIGPLLEWHLPEQRYDDRHWIDPSEVCWPEHGLSHASDRYPCSTSFDHMHQIIRSHFGSSYPATTLLYKEPKWYG